MLVAMTVIKTIKKYYHLRRPEPANVYKARLPFPKRNVSNCYKNHQNYDNPNFPHHTKFYCNTRTNTYHPRMSWIVSP